MSLAKTMSSPLDVLIVGGGPAGLSAALMLSRQMYEVCLFDSGKYRNFKSKHMHSISTWDHHDSAEYRQAARTELLEGRYKTNRVLDRKVTSLRKISQEPTLFEAVDSENECWVGRKVLLASGVRDLYLDIEGYADCWGESIFHCPFCHGFEERDSFRGGVLLAGHLKNINVATMVSGMCRRFAKEITLYTNGSDFDLAAITRKFGFRVEERKIVRFEQIDSDTDPRIRVHLADKSTQELGFMFSSPSTERSVHWEEHLSGLEITETGDIKTISPMQATSVPGVYAAGDTSGPFKAVAFAISQGALVGAGMAHELALEI